MTNPYAKDYVEELSSSGRKRVLGAVLLVGFVLYSIALVFATHLPNVNTIVRIHGFDKVLHCAAYGCQAALAIGVLCVTGRASFRNIIILVGALACFGGLDEITQPRFGRQAEFLDWVADCVGIALGVYFGRCFFLFVQALINRKTSTS
ncbi:MAG: VanZ family protein [Planctomycetaceae bacterium]|nr:VanZ family protein [Planctomycetaceae bacterium]